MQQHWTVSERALVESYDRQQRRRLLLQTSVLVSIVALVLYIVAANPVLFPRTGWTGKTVVFHLLLDPMVMCFWLSFFFAWRGYTRLGALSFTVAAGILLPVDVLFAGLTNYLSVGGFIYLLTAIIIIGVVGERWMLIATTFSISLVTVLLFDFALRPSLYVPYLNITTATGPVPNLILYWGITVLFLAQRQSNQRVLLDLSDVRIQVERARQLDELKDQFIRSVNHELRTPIMTILGYLDILMRPESRTSPELLDRLISNAHRTGEALRMLLGNILDTRRMNLDAGNFAIQALNLTQTVQDVLPLLPPERQDEALDSLSMRDLRLDIPSDLTIWAEPVMLQQILLNLLANAIKYSEAGSPVEVKAQYVVENETNGTHWPLSIALKPAKERKMVEIAVRDYGLGIPPDQVPLLFQRFVRLPRDLESNIVGTGLGLYTCRTLTEKLGGSIWVESTGNPGEGSTFLLRLPVPTVPTVPTLP